MCNDEHPRPERSERQRYQVKLKARSQRFFTLLPFSGTVLPSVSEVLLGVGKARCQPQQKVFLFRAFELSDAAAAAQLDKFSDTAPSSDEEVWVFSRTPASREPGSLTATAPEPPR